MHVVGAIALLYKKDQYFSALMMIIIIREPCCHGNLLWPLVFCFVRTLPGKLLEMLCGHNSNQTIKVQSVTWFRLSLTILFK